MKPGDLYAICQDFTYMEGIVLTSGQLHLIVGASPFRPRPGRDLDSMELITTMSAGQIYTWYLDDFLACADPIDRVLSRVTDGECGK